MMHSLEQRLNSATTTTSHIMERTPNTVYLNNINNIDEIKGKIPDSFYNVVKSDEFRKLQPELYRKIIFHDRRCRISLEIDVADKNNTSTTAMCINTVVLNNEKLKSPLEE